jgi:hypothetical protein
LALKIEILENFLVLDPLLRSMLGWNLLVSNDLLPDGGKLMHFLWTLCFMKVYAKQGPMSVLCGGADQKTIRKWAWAFMSALASLEPDLVRLSVAVILLESSITLTFFACRLFGRID